MSTQRLKLLLILIFPVLMVSTILRIVLFLKELPLPPLTSFLTLVNGALNDLLMISMTFPILIIPLLFMREGRKWPQRTINVMIVMLTGFFTWSSICEWFFWDEFASRLNFIAVDYLIYTKEVVGNIQESFSIPLITIVFLAITIPLCWSAIRLMKKSSVGMQKNSLDPVLFALFISLFAYTQTPVVVRSSKNLVLQELAKNGAYEFFSAFRHNEISFRKMYANTTKELMLETMKKEFSIEGYEPQLVQKHKVYKKAVSHLPAKKLNLIFIAVESLGAKFIGPLGNKENLTPYLNKLAGESLFFSNLYATGTRTVRGLEALSLSLPPTPGASIVRRPKNMNLMSIGKVFQKRGYETKFIYGGHGIFDNMNKFFRNNHYEIVDRTEFKDKEICFSNVWGVADENLLDKVLSEGDESVAKNKNFFSMVLTTSNHRPFTYPEGRIDIPSHTSRAGAVKYTDYALGKFLEKVQTKPWFKDTVIVIVADHSTEGRGVIDVPVETYHIPLFIFAPGLVKPKVVEHVASQIDVIPTVLEVMGIREDNIFFGRNILDMKPEDQRFFVGTYQKVGMYKNHQFVSLGPKKTVQCYAYDPLTKVLQEKEEPCQEDLVTLTESYYQYASFLYRKKIFNDDFLPSAKQEVGFAKK